MTSKVGPKGQVVIPKPIRDALGIQPGEAMEIERSGTEVRMRKRATVEALRGVLPSTGSGLADLEAEHQRELAREDQHAPE